METEATVEEKDKIEDKDEVRVRKPRRKLAENLVKDSKEPTEENKESKIDGDKTIESKEAETGIMPISKEPETKVPPQKENKAVAPMQPDILVAILQSMEKQERKEEEKERVKQEKKRIKEEQERIKEEEKERIKQERKRIKEEEREERRKQEKTDWDKQLERLEKSMKELSMQMAQRAEQQRLEIREEMRTHKLEIKEEVREVKESMTCENKKAEEKERELRENIKNLQDRLERIERDKEVPEVKRTDAFEECLMQEHGKTLKKKEPVTHEKRKIEEVMPVERLHKDIPLEARTLYKPRKKRAIPEKISI